METWGTRDLSLAAWVAYKLGDPSSVERSPNNSNWRSFIFDNSEACQKASIEYLSSESHKFDAMVRAIRKVLSGFDWGDKKQDDKKIPKHEWSTNEISFASFSIVCGAVLVFISKEESASGRCFYRFFFSNESYAYFRTRWNSSEARLFDEHVRRLKRSK